MAFNPKRTLDVEGNTPPRALDLTDKQLARYRNCGQLADHVSPDGKLVTRRRYCGLFRHCTYCLHNRAMGYRKRLLLLLQDDPNTYCQLFTLPYDANIVESSALMKSMGEENYMCLPQVDGSEVIFAHQSCTIPENYQVVTVSESEVRNIDFDKLLATPEGRHVSGILGRPTKDQIDDGKEDVEFEVLAVNTGAKAEEREKCFEQAVAIDSINPAPTDIASLQNAMNRRAMTYAERLVANGHKVSTFKCYEHYRMARNGTSIKSDWLRFEDGKQYLASQYIEDYVEWKALLRSATEPTSLDPNTKVDGD